MTETIIIDQQFCGPPHMGNGGYTCGRIARFIDGPAEVTLRRPAPLGQPLAVERTAGGQVVLTGEAMVIAEARPVHLELEVPPPPTYAEAEAASPLPAQLTDHPFPGCFVCGPGRAETEGLRIFVGPVAGQRVLAAPWIPDHSLADANGYIRPEFLWAALDCPGGWAATAGRPRPILLGQLTAKVNGRVKPGERCIVLSWPITHEGRKHTAGTAICSADGEVYSYARAVWIEPKKD